jgi:DNA-binding MarR family transcriptional regulator
VAGFTGRGWATVTELADFLQARHNAVVTLVQRAEIRGWVRKDPGMGDRRFVSVRLTPRGDALLRALARLHLDEIRRIRTDLHALSRVRPRSLPRVRPGALLKS